MGLVAHISKVLELKRVQTFFGGNHLKHCQTSINWFGEVRIVMKLLLTSKMDDLKVAMISGTIGLLFNKLSEE